MNPKQLRKLQRLLKETRSTAFEMMEQFEANGQTGLYADMTVVHTLAETALRTAETVAEVVEDTRQPAPAAAVPIPA